MPELVNLKDFSMNDLQVNVNEVQETTLPEDQENVALEVNQSTPMTELRRSSRTISSSQRYSPSFNYILLIDKGEPQSYEEVVQVDESTKWKLAMKVDEMDLLMSNQTWYLVELPKGKKSLQNK